MCIYCILLEEGKLSLALFDCAAHVGDGHIEVRGAHDLEAQMGELGI